MKIRTITILALFYGVIFNSKLFAQAEKDVFRIIAVRKDGRTTIQTGFVYRNPSGKIGIITALHGVLNTSHILAENNYNEEYDLKLISVDINHDVAFLSPDKELSSKRSLAVANANSSIGRNVRSLGYPLGRSSIYSRRTSGGDILSIEKMGTLNEEVGSSTKDLIYKRTSPHINMEILFIVGNIRRGESGSPILNSENQVVGMIDGGKEGINWAIPMTNIQLKNIYSQNIALRNIINNDKNADLYSETTYTQLTDPINSEYKVEIFMDKDFSGYQAEVTDDWTISDEKDPWFNAISSIKIPTGWKITVYTGFNFSGTSTTLTSNWNAIYWADQWNDKINSIRIIQRH